MLLSSPLMAAFLFHIKSDFKHKLALRYEIPMAGMSDKRTVGGACFELRFILPISR
jgi:hypothetical protein